MVDKSNIFCAVCKGATMQPDKYYVFDIAKPVHFVNIGDHTGDQDYIHTRRIMPDY